MNAEDKQRYETYARIYRVLSNSKRLEILNVIKDQEHSVDNIARKVGIRKVNLFPTFDHIKTEQNCYPET